MEKLGTKSKPAIVKVQTEERAMEIMALCAARDWQVIVGIEPDNAENIDDIKKLEAGLKPELKFNSLPSRNAPCPAEAGNNIRAVVENENDILMSEV